MLDELTSILSGPFLLVQIGDYGEGYDAQPLPTRIASLADERANRNVEHNYPRSLHLPPPHYHIPYKLDGILLNKFDELSLNGLAYWAQALSARVGPQGCINSAKSELIATAAMLKRLWAVLVTKIGATVAPKGSTTPGKLFKRWKSGGIHVAEAPTDHINTEIVYTESGKDTLVFDSLRILANRVPIDVNDFHVYFTSSNGLPRELCYQGKRLPYRSSGFGTCSLMAPGKPDVDTEIRMLSRQTAHRTIVAVASLHPHVCGRVSA